MAETPRPASTVVLVDHLSRVYLTKRPKTMKFFGGYYVFPGGAVEKSDYEIDNVFIIKRKQHVGFDQAYYVAAARELFEEVGVLITDDQSIISRAKVSEYRSMILKGEITFLEMLKKENLHINLEDLIYFGHRITGKEKPIRFETRFFLTYLPKGQNPMPDFNEIDEAKWFSPNDALSAYEKGEIFLPPPTILALKTIINFQDGLPLNMPEY